MGRVYSEYLCKHCGGDKSQFCLSVGEYGFRVVRSWIKYNHVVFGAYLLDW